MDKNLNIMKLVRALSMVSLIVPFIVIPERAPFFTAILMIFYGTVVLFYNAFRVFSESDEDDIMERSFSGLPGEVIMNPVVKKAKKQRKVKIDASLPGFVPPLDTNKSGTKNNQKEPEQNTSSSQASVSSDNAYDWSEVTTFWNELSFYKTSESPVLSKMDTKDIGGLLEYVFAGAGSYLQRYKLSIGDIAHDNQKAQEQSYTLGEFSIGYIMILVEREIDKKKGTKKTAIVVPEFPANMPEPIVEVFKDKKFDNYIALLVNKYNEKKDKKTT